jgi:hypothetical protein
MKEESRIYSGRTRGLFPFDGISWSAIFAGVVMALVIQLVLSILGVGIGAASVSPQTEQSPFAGLGIGSAIWLFISSIIAMYVGGWVAGRASGVYRRSSGALHGAVVWGLSVLVTTFFLTSAAGALVSGTSSLLGGVMSTTTQAAASSPELSQEIKEALRQRGIDLNSIQQEAQKPQTQEQASQQAREAGEKVAGGISMAGIFGFIGLLIGFLAAAFGGRNGVPVDVVTTAVPADRAA